MSYIFNVWVAYKMGCNMHWNDLHIHVLQHFVYISYYTCRCYLIHALPCFHSCPKPCYYTNLWCVHWSWWWAMTIPHIWHLIVLRCSIMWSPCRVNNLLMELKKGVSVETIDYIVFFKGLKSVEIEIVF